MTVIIGSGLAGLSVALSMAPQPVTILSRKSAGAFTSSELAQGGIAAAVGADDNPELHAADTLKAGDGLCDPAIVRMITSAGPQAIAQLAEWGVEFDRDSDGKYKLGLEGAHCRRRIVHAHGDGTGAAIIKALVARAKATPSITFIENAEVVSLIADERGVTGITFMQRKSPSPQPLSPPRGGEGLPLSFDLSFQDVNNNTPVIDIDSSVQKGSPSPPLGGERGWGEGDLRLRLGEGDLITLQASNVVLATGGAGALWQHTTNPLGSWGHGIALAARVGAHTRDLAFMQFHPTAIDVGLDPMPLASEALRGEGAVLVNDNGEKFMAGIVGADLAPRDVVSRAIWAQLQAGRRVFLDARNITAFAARFPTIHALCAASGIDPQTQPIPVRPAAHYHMGGVATDAYGRTNIAGLWACGEVAATGLHGANRLASNSLLEAVVFGCRMSDVRGRRMMTDICPLTSDIRHLSSVICHLSSDIRQIMSRHVGVLRDKSGLEQAVAELTPLAETSDMALVGLLVAKDALSREECRGAHWRVDFC